MTAILSLSLISGPDQVRLETRVVEGYEFTLGRGHDADWSLVDPETNILSRRHCMLSQEDGDWWLLDMSGNGTFLNHEQEPIGDGGKRRLRDGDRIRLGVYEFQAQLAEAEPVRSSFQAGADPWPSSRDTMDGPIGAIAPAPRGGGAAGGFANPFADEDEEQAAPVRPMPAVTPPAGRSGNPFADVPDDAADDGWPSPEATPAPPSASPPVAVELGNPFADGPGGSEVPIAPERRPARRPTAWLSESPPVAAEPPFGGPAAESPRDGAPSHAAVHPTAASADPFADPEAANPFAEPGDALAVDEPAAPLVSFADTQPPEDEPPAPRAAPPPVTEPVPAPVVPRRDIAEAAPASGVAGAPQAVTAPTDAVLLRALLRGAGIPDATPRDPEQSLLALGAAFRAMITGLREVQRARRTVRGGFRIAQTAWTENPLKLAVNEDDALEALLGAGRRSAMPPARAVEEVLKEIVLHEVATVAAMQEAVRTLLASLSPDKLREIAEQGAGLTVLPAQRKARAWDTYETTHARVTAALQDDFDSVFGRAFARAYERVMAEQKE